MKLLLAFIFTFLFFQQDTSEKIIWNENQKLTWEDFRGRPVRNAGFVASTNTGINFGYSYKISNDGVSVEYSVESFFSPEKSWYFQGQISQHVLNHEQTHFDISELHARILRKRLGSQKFSKKVKAEIETIYLQVEEQRKTMQKKFDAETDHSRNIEKELQWEKRIAKQLVNYESWKWPQPKSPH